MSSKNYNLITCNAGSRAIVEELRDYLNSNAKFAKAFEDSFRQALASGIRDFEDHGIKTLEDYINWYENLLGWVPTEQEDGQFVYHVLCLFYYVMNIQPLESYINPIDPSTKAPYTWLSDWVVRYSKEIGKVMDSPESITSEAIDTFFQSPAYNMDIYVRPQGDWQTFNQFFARQIKPEARPIADESSDKTIVSPADAVFDGHWPIDDKAQVVFVKGIPWCISQLLDDSSDPNGSQYAPAFAGGTFCHSFLGPNDYHRQHAPVSGTVIEARYIEGLCYLQVELVEDKDGKTTVAPRRKLLAPPLRLPQGGGSSGAGKREGEGGTAPQDSINAPDEPGYQFIQARALILIDNPDLGLVAVLPIGMACVSSVVLTVQPGECVSKGQEISYFQFGGSDIIVCVENKANVEFDAVVGRHYNMGEKIASANPSSAST